MAQQDEMDDLREQAERALLQRIIESAPSGGGEAVRNLADAYAIIRTGFPSKSFVA